jgi:hypothetical protein
LSVIVATVVTATGRAVSANHPIGNYLTFGRSVALPGVMLQAGLYRFEVVRLESGYVFELDKPGVGKPVAVQVTSDNGRRVHYRGFTWRVARPAGMPADQAISLGEAPRGEPMPIRTWYPIGEAYGHQFIW